MEEYHGRFDSCSWHRKGVAIVDLSVECFCVGFLDCWIGHSCWARECMSRWFLGKMLRVVI